MTKRLTDEERKARKNERARKFRAENPELARAKDRERHERNRERPEFKAKQAAYNKAYAQRHGFRKYQLKSKYGLTLEQFDRMLALQGNVCAICGGEPHQKVRNVKRDGVKPQYVVDHDHATGKVRGLLCHSCNSTLGYAKDSPANLRAAAHYLELHRGHN